MVKHFHAVRIVRLHYDPNGQPILPRKKMIPHKPTFGKARYRMTALKTQVTMTTLPSLRVLPQVQERL